MNALLANCIYCGRRFLSINGKSHCHRFECRAKNHDEKEEKIMGAIRQFTTRRHLPDRWISFNGKLCAWDLKTSSNVEDNSHDEYFRLLKHDNIPVFIVYIDKSNGQELANWIQELNWDGPYPPSPNSTCDDSYYRISNGIPFKEFLELQKTNNAH